MNYSTSNSTTYEKTQHKILVSIIFYSLIPLLKFLFQEISPSLVTKHLELSKVISASDLKAKEKKVANYIWVKTASSVSVRC